jgi:hypothetical protein
MAYRHGLNQLRNCLRQRSRAFRRSRRPSRRCKRLRELHAPDPLLVSQCELPCCIWDIQCLWQCPSSSNGRRSWLLSPRCYLLFDRLSCRHAASLEPRSGLECVWRDESVGTASSYVTRWGIILWRVNSLEASWLALSDRVSIRVRYESSPRTFAGGPSSPRTDVLGHSQPSLRDCSFLSFLPRTASWAILSRPFGTVHSSHFYSGLRPGEFSAVPSGLFLLLISTQDCVLGYSQPSLRDCSFFSFLPRTESLAILSRPYGTVPSSHFYPGLRPGLFSAVPSGTVPSSHFYPGLRPGLFSAVPSGLI